MVSVNLFWRWTKRGFLLRWITDRWNFTMMRHRRKTNGRMPLLQWNRRAIAPSGCLLQATPGMDRLAFMCWGDSKVNDEYFGRTFWNGRCLWTSQICLALILSKSFSTWIVLLPTPKDCVYEWLDLHGSFFWRRSNGWSIVLKCLLWIILPTVI